MVVGIVEQAHHLRPHGRVDGKKRTHDDNIVGLNVRIDKVYMVMGMVFVEEVFGIVVLIEESE